MIVDGEREHVLHLKNVLCRFLGVNGGSRTGEQSLQGLGPVFVGDGLRGDGGFSVHPLEHLLQFKSPSPSKAAEASSMCIYERLVTEAIQRQVWQSMHR
jgi:hypothetical protein